jgi:signal transduction histidine kinase
MMESFQKQIQIKSLPPFGIYRKPRLKEADLNEIARTVDAVLPEYMHADTVAEVALSEKGLAIMADIALLQGALISLVKNAMDAMPDGGVFSLNTGRVNFENRTVLEVNGDNFGPCAFVSLTDTGPGIDAKIEESIFEPFFTTNSGKSKGRGLPIAYHIIKAHGGSMKVESTPGQGTAINLYLPLAKPEIVNKMIPIPLPAPYGRNLLNSRI